MSGLDIAASGVAASTKGWDDGQGSVISVICLT